VRKKFVGVQNMAKAKKNPVEVVDVEIEKPKPKVIPPAKFACAHNATENPRNLKPHPENPNFHPKKQIQNYIQIIKANGWRRPITVSETTGYIVKGHGACLAAIEAGWTEVPVDYQAYDSFELELADLLADNELGSQSEQNDEKVKEIMTELLEIDFDVDLTGFTPEALADVMKPKAPKTPRKKKGNDDAARGLQKYHLDVIFLSDEERAYLYEELKERGIEVRIP
jgi:hypothetical protein